MFSRAFRGRSGMGFLRAPVHTPPLTRFVVPKRNLNRNFSIPSVSGFLADSLAEKCTSCGIMLQKTKPDSPGYFIEPKASLSGTQKIANAAPTRPEDKTFDDYYTGLSREDRELLLNGAEAKLMDSAKNKIAKSSLQQTRHGHQCLRCRNAFHYSEFATGEYKTDSVGQVMQRIPENGNIVYVVSLMDFPMSLNETVFRFRSAKTMQFVITKSDLLFSTNNLASRYGAQFFQDYMFRTYGVPRSQVHVVSGKSDWNTELFLTGIRDNSYFIGCVNSGKSTLLQLVMQVARKQREKLPNARKERAVQKQQDDIILHARTYAAAKIRLRMMAKEKAEIGPGASFMPGFTRGVIPLELSKSTTVFDVPGFSEEHEAHLHNFLSAKSIKQLQKGAFFFKNGTYLSKYITAKEGQAVTVGGLFFLQVPRGCMFQIRNVINHKVHVFSNMEKALQVWENAKDPNAVRDVFLVDHNKTSVLKYVIPPFEGSCDIVLRGLGFINIKATGARPDPATAEDLLIYIPKGIEATARVPISKYIMRSLSGRDKRGNVLRKEKWVQLSTKEIKRFTGKEPFSWPILPAS